MQVDLNYCQNKKYLQDKLLISIDVLSINQVYQWKSSFLNMEPANNSCMFPVEVFTIVPITFMFVNLIAQADRTLSFGIFYPIVVFMLGVLIPLYIIVKKKMKFLSLEISLEKIKVNFLDQLQQLKKSCTKCVSPFVVNQ